MVEDDDGGGGFLLCSVVATGSSYPLVHSFFFSFVGFLFSQNSLSSISFHSISHSPVAFSLFGFSFCSPDFSFPNSQPVTPSRHSSPVCSPGFFSQLFLSFLVLSAVFLSSRHQTPPFFAIFPFLYMGNHTPKPSPQRWGWRVDSHIKIPAIRSPQKPPWQRTMLCRCMCGFSPFFLVII